MLTNCLSRCAIECVKRDLALDYVSDVTLMAFHLWTVCAYGLPQYVARTAYQWHTLGDLVTSGSFGYHCECGKRDTTHCTLDNHARCLRL